MTYSLNDFLIAALVVFTGPVVMALIILVLRWSPKCSDTYRPPNTGYQPKGPKNGDPGEPPHAGSSGKKD